MHYESISPGNRFDQKGRRQVFKSPVEFTDEGIKYMETENSIDENGKIITINKDVEEKLFETDSIIIAVSQSPKNNIVNNTKGIETNKWGLIVTDDRGNTTREGVFATGADNERQYVRYRIRFGGRHLQTCDIRF